MNPEVWGIINHAVKATDLRLQSSQKLLLTATHALTKVCTLCVCVCVCVCVRVCVCVCVCVSSAMETRGLLKDVMDAKGLILKTSYDLPIDRRGQILKAPQVNKKYRKMASTEISVTIRLFGDAL